MKEDPWRAGARRRFLAAHAGPHNRLVWQINWDLVVSTLPDLQGRIVDLGCGTSPYRELFEHEGHEVVAVDWPTGFHGRQGVDVFADVASAVPFRDASVRTATAFHVLEHLRDPARFLAEVSRVLVPGGRLVLSVPFMWGVHEEPHDYFRFTRFGLDHLFANAGLRVLRIQEATGFWTMVALKVNYRTRRGARGWRRLVWRPIWGATQGLARILDQRGGGKDETGGYLVVAERPA